MTRAVATVLWRAIAPDQLRWAFWSVDTSLFNADTGETHLLGPLPAEVLALLSRRPWPFADLRARLATLCEVEDDAAWGVTIADILRQLGDLELVDASTGPVVVSTVALALTPGIGPERGLILPAPHAVQTFV